MVEMECKGQKTNLHEEKMRFHVDLLNTPEGHIFLAGVVTAFLGFVFLTYSWFRVPLISQSLFAMTATNIFFGRAAGMSLGYTMNFGHIVVIPVNMIVETILVFLFYPLFVFSWRRLLVIKALKNVMESTRKVALAHQKTIQRYGFLGLFVFVWSPFWMTGPVVGCAIGFLLDLRLWLNLTIVLSGTYMAIICWAIMLSGIHNHVAAYSPFAPIVLFAIIILIALASHFFHTMKHDKDFR